MVQLHNETSLEFATNILSTTFRERSNLAMYLRYDKVSANRSGSECSNLYLQLVHVLHSKSVGVYQCLHCHY